MIVQCIAKSFFSEDLEIWNSKGDSKVEDFDVRVKSEIWWVISGCIGVGVEVLH